MVEKVGASSFRGNLHKGTAEKFKGLAADLEEADKLLDAPHKTSPSAQRGPIQLSLSIEDVEGLPDELVKELSLSDADKLEFEIVNAIEEAGGVISLDRLLISVFKRTGEIHKRAYLTNRLARMAQKNVIYYVPGRKGVYSTEQLSSEDVVRLFGAVKQEAIDNA
jgi:hypothetical protein